MSKVTDIQRNSASKQNMQDSHVDVLNKSSTSSNPLLVVMACLPRFSSRTRNDKARLASRVVWYCR